MKYLKKYKFIIERKDLEKREEIRDMMNDIMILIRNHFVTIADNILTNKNHYIDYIFSTTYENFEFYPKTLEIPLKNFKFIIKIKKYDSNVKGKADKIAGSYEKNGNKYILTIPLDKFYELIRKIFTSNNNQELQKIKKDIARYKLENKEKQIIFHELIHATDDMKFDLFKELIKACSKSKLYDICDAGLANDPEYNAKLDPNFIDEYDKVYANLTTEYNAFFLAAVDKLIIKLKNGDIKWNQINSFNTFKEFFTMLSLRNFDFYGKTTRFKKHYDKRMYDLFIKLKEKYETKKFESNETNINTKKYWKILYSDFDVAMDKLNIPNQRRMTMKQSGIDNHMNLNDEILITNFGFNSLVGWNWRFAHDSIINNPEWTNMGNLIITSEDRKQYEIKTKAKKYNIL
jgi:hypothetical protein